MHKAFLLNIILQRKKKLQQKEMGALVQQMREVRPVSDEEYREFLKYITEYNLKKKERKEKFHNSMLYNIYLLFKKEK